MFACRVIPRLSPFACYVFTIPCPPKGKKEKEKEKKRQKIVTGVPVYFPFSNITIKFFQEKNPNVLPSYKKLDSSCHLFSSLL